MWTNQNTRCTFSQVLAVESKQTSSTESSQSGFSLKTPPCSCEEDCKQSSQTLTGWGMMRSGVCYQRKPLVLAINAPEYGSRPGEGIVYPTIRCLGMCGGDGAGKRINKLAADGIITEEERRLFRGHTGVNPEWGEWLMGWLIGWTDLGVDNGSLTVYDIGVDPAITGQTKRTNGWRAGDVCEKRIMAIGNGQVPICAACAFEYGLTRFEKED